MDISSKQIIPPNYTQNGTFLGYFQKQLNPIHPQIYVEPVQNL